ncbi:hypothetical protein ACU8M5_10455 [Rhizobium leguminosarum]
MNEEKKTFTLTLPVNDPIAMREFERATGAVRFEVQEEAPQERVLAALQAAAAEKCAAGVDPGDCYPLFMASVQEVNESRRSPVVPPTFGDFKKRLKRMMKDRRNCEARYAGWFETPLAPFLDEIRLDGAHLKSTLERVGAWHLLPKEERDDILALSPWMTIVFDDRTKLIHSLRFSPLRRRGHDDRRAV